MRPGKSRYSAAVHVDTTKWSGEGVFTATVVETLRTIPSIDSVRVEDAPSSRADSGFNFISNEVYVRFRAESYTEPGRWLGFVPVRRTAWRPVSTLTNLEVELASVEAVGAADYVDDGMVQYLKTERVIPPYQTRGYKIAEMVRIYALPFEPGP